MKIILEIANPTKGKTLLNFLKTLGYIKSIKVLGEDEDFDWVSPGRPASMEEHEELAYNMDNDVDSGMEAKSFFDGLRKEIT
jgi:hypothetical protein